MSKETDEIDEMFGELKNDTLTLVSHARTDGIIVGLAVGFQLGFVFGLAVMKFFGG